MVKGNLFLAVVLFIFGTIISIKSYFYWLGKLASPDAGTFPFGIGIVLMICSVSLIIISVNKLKKSHSVDVPVWSGVNLTKVSMILGSLLLYILLLEPLGFLACAFLIQFLLFKVAGGQRWLWAVLATSITLTVVYLVFFWGLGVYVPLFPVWIY